MLVGGSTSAPLPPPAVAGPGGYYRDKNKVLWYVDSAGNHRYQGQDGLWVAADASPDYTGQVTDPVGGKVADPVDAKTARAGPPKGPPNNNPAAGGPGPAPMNPYPGPGTVGPEIPYVSGQPNYGAHGFQQPGAVPLPVPPPQERNQAPQVAAQHSGQGGTTGQALLAQATPAAPVAPIAPGTGTAVRPELDLAWRQNDQYNQMYGRANTGFGQQGADYFPEAADPNGAQAIAYQSSEGRPLAWAHYITRESDPNSYYGRWLADQFKRVESAYANTGILTGDKEQLFTDWVNRAAPGLANEYLRLPSWQQGKNATPWFAGRRM